jgi:hypothetical protein
MSEHQKVPTFWRHVILYDDSNERCKPEKSIAQVQHHKRFVQHLASAMALLTVLAMVGVGWMVVFAGLLMGYPKKLKRLQHARPVVTRRQESHLGKPEIITLPGSGRGSDDGEAFQGAAEVRGYHGSLDSPSWPSN